MKINNIHFTEGMTEVWPAEVLNQIQSLGILRLEELSSLNNQTRKVCLPDRDEAKSHLSHVIRLPILNYPLLTRQWSYSAMCSRDSWPAVTSLQLKHPVSVSRWTTIEKHWNKWTDKINFSFISSLSAFSNSLHICL